MRVLMISMFLITSAFASERGAQSLSKNRTKRMPASVSSSSLGSQKTLGNLGLKGDDLKRTLYSADLYQERPGVTKTAAYGDPKIFDERVGQ